MSFVGGCSCGARVLRVDISATLTTVDAQPHPSGRIEVHYAGPFPYGRLLAHGEPPRAGRTRHRRHQCTEGTNA